MNKFSAELEELLKQGIVKLPGEAKFEYEKFKAFRGIKIEGDQYEISKKDFVPTNVGFRQRGATRKNIYSYSTSLYLSEINLYKNFNMSSPKKTAAYGYVCELGGPHMIEENGHVHWWIYDNYDDFSSFEIRKRREEWIEWNALK